jgi:hypothetical protein
MRVKIIISAYLNKKNQVKSMNSSSVSNPLINLLCRQVCRQEHAICKRLEHLLVLSEGRTIMYYC